MARRKMTQKLYSPEDSETIVNGAEVDEESEEVVQIEPIVTLNDTLSYTVPKDSEHPDAGKKVERPFDYQRVRDDEAALSVIADKKWTLTNMVNKILKANARSSAYQTAALIYNPEKTISAEEVFDRMVRDLIRNGFSETIARGVAKNAMDEAVKQKADSDKPAQPVTTT